MVCEMTINIWWSFFRFVTQMNEADQCFQDIPRTPLSLQLATYYYALQLYTLLRSKSKTKAKAERDPIYSRAPDDVVKSVLGHVSSADQSDWSDELRELHSKLLHYQEVLADFVQAQVLQGLGKGSYNFTSHALKSVWQSNIVDISQVKYSTLLYINSWERLLCISGIYKG